LLSGIKARKIYVHINNTNPMLDESGAEYSEVRARGWEIGEDGWEFRL
jgi:pyrroloquinoline quinone biosynthesis protein B